MKIKEVKTSLGKEWGRQEAVNEIKQDCTIVLSFIQGNILTVTLFFSETGGISSTHGTLDRS